MSDMNVANFLEGGDELEDEEEFEISEEKELALLKDETEILDHEPEDDLDILSLNDETEDLIEEEEDVNNFELPSNDHHINERKRISAPTPTPIPKENKAFKSFNKKKTMEKKFSGNFNYRNGNRTKLNTNRENQNSRRNKTVLINPRFKGSVHLNGPSAWLQPYPEPAPVVWSNQNQQVPQTPIVVNSPPVVPPTIIYQAQQLPNMLQASSLQMCQQPIMPQPIIPQHHMYPQQQPIPQCSQYQQQQHFQEYQQPVFQQSSLNANIQVQVPVQFKPPVHQRLGIPSNQQYNQPPKQMPYDNTYDCNTEQQLHYEPPLRYEPPPKQMPYQMTSNQSHYNDQHNIKYTNNTQVYPENFQQQNNDQEYRARQHQHKNLRYNNNNRGFNKNKWKNNQNKGQKQQKRQDILIKEEKPNVNSALNISVPTNEDEETRLYREKIEQQKRTREEVLRKKEENRRKLLESEKFEQPRVTNKMSREPHQSFNNNKNTNNIVIMGNSDHPRKHKNNRFNNNRNFQNRNQYQKQERTISKPVSNLTMILPTEDIGKASSDFLAERQVTINEPALMPSRQLLVKNLSSSTSENKLIQMCSGFGGVQKLQMEKQERQAKIQFEKVESAQAFYKKYRRCMIDLSMIEVELITENIEI